MSARKLALDATQRCRRDGAWLGDILGPALDRSSLEPRDKAFAARLARGVSEHIGTLDEIIDEVADRPSRIEPQVRDAFRIAAYEALFLDTPPRAVVSEGVNLVRAVRPRAAGYANAVLRRLTERAGEFPFGDPAVDLPALARQTGHPLWLAELFVNDLGEPLARQMLAADAQPAPFACTANPFISTTEDAYALLSADGAAPKIGALGTSILCDEPAAAVKGAAIGTGSVVVSDEASQAICAAVPVVPGGTLVDVAAGRGTKTVLLQAAAYSAGAPMRVTAVDVFAFKTQLLDKRMRELRVPEVTSITVDATDSAAIGALDLSADLVFVDAPCSGLGTLRRHPEKRWSVTPESITELAALGARLLEASASLVGIGGFMVYSTCTVTDEENASVVRAFLERHDGDYVCASLSGDVHESFAQWIGPEGWFQSIPVPGGPDGHFAAVLQRVR